MNPPNGITVLPNGQWTVTDDTHISEWARQKGHIITDPHLFRFLKPYLADAEVVWDIGACIGDHTRQYLDWGKEVVAVEPNPLSFICLVENCPEAHAINAAASDTSEGLLRFEVAGNVGASRISDDGGITVRQFALDDENLPCPHFVKIDVEGWELSALRGMRETLEDCRPVVFCEINVGALAGNGVTPDDLIAWMADVGYSVGRRYPEGVAEDAPQYDILFTPNP